MAVAAILCFGVACGRHTLSPAYTEAARNALEILKDQKVYVTAPEPEYSARLANSANALSNSAEHRRTWLDAEVQQVLTLYSKRIALFRDYWHETKGLRNIDGQAWQAFNQGLTACEVAIASYLDHGRVSARTRASCSPKQPNLAKQASVCILEKYIRWQDKDRFLCLQMTHLTKSTVIAGQTIPRSGVLLSIDLLEEEESVEPARLWQEFRGTFAFTGQLWPRDFHADVNQQGKGVIGFAQWNSIELFEFDLSAPIVPFEKESAQRSRNISIPTEKWSSRKLWLEPFLNNDEKRFFGASPVQLKSLKQEGFDVVIVTRAGGKEQIFRCDSKGQWSRS